MRERLFGRGAGVANRRIFRCEPFIEAAIHDFHVGVAEFGELRNDAGSIVVARAVEDQHAVARKSDGKRLDLHHPGIIDGAGDVRIDVAVDGSSCARALGAIANARAKRAATAKNVFMVTSCCADFPAE